LTLVRNFARIPPLKFENLAHIWAAHESIADRQSEIILKEAITEGRVFIPYGIAKLCFG
jgi:hypothetical protein